MSSVSNRSAPSRLGLDSLKVVSIALSIDSERETSILNRLCGRLKRGNSGFICWLSRLSLFLRFKVGAVVRDYQSFFICCVYQNILAFLRVPCGRYKVEWKRKFSPTNNSNKCNGQKLSRALKFVRRSYEKFFDQVVLVLLDLPSGS